MEYAYKYGDACKLYLNVTNRCTNRCSFCVRYRTEGLGGALLRGDTEPDIRELQAAVLAHGPLEGFREFIWCGYGEPTFRLDLILQAAPWLRSRGAAVRLDTNGHACLIRGRDVLLEIAQAVDEVSVSLNAPDCRRYLELCNPDSDSIPRAGPGIPDPGIFWDAMLDFLSRSPGCFKRTQASVVGYVLAQEEIDRCRSLARSLGVERFKVR